MWFNYGTFGKHAFRPMSHYPRLQPNNSDWLYRTNCYRTNTAESTRACENRVHGQVGVMVCLSIAPENNGNKPPYSQGQSTTQFPSVSMVFGRSNLIYAICLPFSRRTSPPLLALGGFRSTPGGAPSILSRVRILCGAEIGSYHQAGASKR